MDNPFSDLRKMREAQEERRKSEELKDRQKERQYLEELQAEANAIAHYSDLVMSVLEQFRQVLYPDSKVDFYINQPTFITGSMKINLDDNIKYPVPHGWFITHEFEPSDDPGATRTAKDVTVTLQFDAKNNPNRFNCSLSKSNEMNAGLSREELSRPKEIVYKTKKVTVMCRVKDKE